MNRCFARLTARVAQVAQVIPVALLLALAAAAAPAGAALRILACEPEWGALAQELGGDRVDVFIATTAAQDVHQIQARPSLIARARSADLAVCTGAELEIGWLPVLLQQSGNARIQSGQPGHFEAADYVTRLEVPARVDRSEGDIHPAGNPHIQTDPRNIALVAQALAQRLAQLAPADSAIFATRTQDFIRRWQQAIARWEQAAAPLAGVAFVAHHNEWVYLETWLHLKRIALLEPKPGVEPTATHLEEVLAALKLTPATFIVYAAYQDPRADQWLAGRAAIPAVKLPYTVGGSDAAKDLFGLFDDTIAQLLKGAAAR